MTFSFGAANSINIDITACKLDCFIGSHCDVPLQMLSSERFLFYWLSNLLQKLLRNM